jgi:hypothetical protein
LLIYTSSEAQYGHVMSASDVFVAVAAFLRSICGWGNVKLECMLATGAGKRHATPGARVQLESDLKYKEKSRLSGSLDLKWIHQMNIFYANKILSLLDTLNQ